MKTNTYNITGMSCAACSASVNKVVSRLEGVVACEVNLITSKMTVTFDETRVNDSDFFRVVEKAGFGITKENSEKKADSKDEKISFYPIILSALFSGILLVISMGKMLFPTLPLPAFIDPEINPYNFALTQLLLCLPALYFGRRFFTNGIPLLLKGHPNMDSLVALGALSSLVYSIAVTYTIPNNHHAIHSLYYESVAVVITLVMLGKTMEQKSRNKTLTAIKTLMELSPETAILERDGKQITVLTEQVQVGDILVVKAGNKIPLDGIIIKGETAIDESMLTGESLPVEKKENSNVTGGSLNLTGLIHVKVTHTGKDTALAKIIKFVEDAQSKKAPISKTADKVAGVFVPIVLGIAVISAIIWLILGKELGFVLKIFTSVLVVACPCSLGLATPTAIMVGTGLGAKNGILIRNGEVLETTHKTRVAVFDKTGTLTLGTPSVTDIVARNREKLLKACASAEMSSEHPLSKAVINFAKQNNIIASAPENAENIAGKGIRCEIEGKTVLVGNRELLSENGISSEIDAEKTQQLASQGKSLIFVAEDNEYLGFLAVADPLKPTSEEAIERLKAMDIKTVLLSGDNKLSAEYAGKSLGVDEIYSQILPTEKANIVTEIREKYGISLMVGDGINDAPALTNADIGCAIGSGSDVAVESADIILMKNDPYDVARSINLSRLTITNIKQNLFWAFCYNTICIPIASLGLLSPMLAGLAMSLSSVFVVGNALRLRFKKL